VSPKGLRAFLNAPGSPDRGSVHFHCRRDGEPARVVASLAVGDCSRFVSLDLNCGPQTAHTAVERLAKLDALLDAVRQARAIFEAECEAAGLLDAPEF